MREIKEKVFTEVVNFNEKYKTINLANLPNGKNQNIEIKIGRSFYMLDIDKNCLDCSIHMYKKAHKDRNKYSKYGNMIGSIRVKNNAILEKNVFENIKEIEKAQETIKKYKSILN